MNPKQALRIFALATAFAALASADAIPLDVNPDDANRPTLTFTVIPTLGPNFNSPSYTGYSANVIQSLETNLAPIGNQLTDPTAFNYNYNVTSKDFITTNFNSWRGVADPGGALAKETGNFLYYAVKIDAGTGFFNLAGLTDFAFSVDPHDYWRDLFSFSNSVYSTDLVGKRGNTFITSGSASQYVNELFFVGVGLSFDGTNFTGVTDQAKLNEAILLANSINDYQPNYIRLAYQDRGYHGAGFVSDGPTLPEPGTVILMGGGLIALSIIAQRIRKWTL